MSERSNIGKLGAALWRVVPLVFVIGILCVVFAPEEFKKMKRIGLMVIYCSGLPFLLGAFILFSEKKGWLK
jgi:hypothetical protein